jgi:Gamma-butyrobetaine hydroxylase-like, N-terminal/Taurine catabolism dioxygenase TauD, TfdA family
LIGEAGLAGADLELTAGERRLRFPAIWLRDNCPCAECTDPGTGQKLKDITEVPNELAITLTEDIGESVAVTFAPDGHRLFDVRVEPEPGNLAFTSQAILPHTDNPYRDPVPTVQLLHCLATAGSPGRHLQGCYADLDGLASTVAVLRREGNQ